MTDAFNNTDDNRAEWVCGVSHTKIQQGYLLAGFMFISGLALMFYLKDASQDATLIGMVNIVFAAFILFMTRRTLRNSQRLLVINDDGVWFRDWKGPVIPWKQILNVKVGGSRIKASVQITLKNPDAVVTLLDASDRTGFEKNPLVNMPVLKIPNATLSVPLDEVAEKIKEYARKARAAS